MTVRGSGAGVRRVETARSVTLARTGCGRSASLTRQFDGDGHASDCRLTGRVRRAHGARLSADFHYEGLPPAMLERLRDPDPDNPRLSEMREKYGRTSPDGADHWPTFYRKVCAMGSTGPTPDFAELQTIKRPALVVAADDDVVDHHHTVTMFEVLPDAQLAIVPGTTHLLCRVLALIEQFLDSEPPWRMMPMRTAGVA